MRETKRPGQVIDALERHLVYCRVVFDEKFESSRKACAEYDESQTMQRIGGAHPDDPWVLEVKQQQAQAAQELRAARRARDAAVDALAKARQPSLLDRQWAMVKTQAPQLAERFERARAALADATAADDE